MAFRGYELNLILRVQDRATTRVRRLAADLGGVNRAAALQRQSARLAQAQQRSIVNQQRLQNELAARTTATASTAISHQSRLNSLKATEIGYTQKLKSLGIDLNRIQSVHVQGGRTYARMVGGQIQSLTQKEAQLALRGLSNQQRILATETAQAEKLAQITAELSAATAEEALLAAEAAKVERHYAHIAALEKTARRGSMLMHVGSTAAFTGGVGLAVLGGAASSFANFNRESVKAATQMRGVNEGFSSSVKVAGLLQNEILDLTRIFPGSASEMAQSAYEIASGMDLAGTTTQRFNETSKLLRVTNRVAVAGFTDLGSATETMITILNNFDPAAVRTHNGLRVVNRDMNTIFATVRFGRGDFTQFSELFGGVAAAARGAGQSLIQTGSALAFLTTRLPRPQAAAGYQRLIQILSLPMFRAGFKDIFQLPITDINNGVERLKPLSEIINIITAESLKFRKEMAQGARLGPDQRFVASLTQGGVNLFNLIQEVTKRGQLVLTGREGQGQQGTIQARRALTNLILGWQEYRHILRQVTGDTKEFDRSFAAASQTPGIRWQIAINQFKAFAIIIGQDVLPVIIRFVGWLTNMAHRFEDLSPRTRSMIGHFIAWGSIASLLGGLLLVMVGALTRLIVQLRLMAAINAFNKLNSEVTATTTSVSILGRGLAGLAGIGLISIPIIMAITKKGDPKAWDFISGAFEGAAGGALVGSAIAPGIGTAIGAGIGAVAVPITIEVISHFKAHPQTDIDPIFRAYQKYLNQQIQSHGRVEFLSFSQFKAQGLQRAFMTQERPQRGGEIPYRWDLRLAQLDNKNKSTTKSILDEWRDLAGQLTGLDLFGSLSQQMATNAANIQLNLAKAQASGNKTAIQTALKAEIQFDKAQIARLNKMPRTAATEKSLIELYKDQAQAQQQLTQFTKQSTQATAQETLQAEKLRAASQARKDQLNTISQAADNLVQKYQELKQANEAAFSIFQGPVSQGPIAQIFNQINTTLQGFGARPIAIPVTLQIQDLSTQVRNFEMFRKDLDALRKRGAPRELVTQLQARGVEALPLLEGLRKSAPGAFRSYVAMWKRSQKDIATATEKDMNTTLKLWKSYGGDIAWQIVQGLASDKAQATLKAGYQKWIVSTFGKQLSAGIQKQVQEAVAEWMKEHPANTRARKAPNPATGNTRTTQNVQTTNVNHGDTYVTHADGATPNAVARAHNQLSFQNRRKRNFNQR